VHAAWHSASAYADGLCTVPRLYDGVYAFMDEEDFMEEDQGARFAGTLWWPVPAAEYAYDLGRVLGTIQLGHGLDAYDFSVVLAREYPAQDRPWRLYVQLDPARSRPVDMSSADVLTSFKRSLMLRPYVPTEDRHPALFARFREGYLQAARDARRERLGEDVLEDMQDYDMFFIE
jgi:hypothetical protein